MEKIMIQAATENCTGCRRCQLACSELYHQAFNPAAARIRVEGPADEVSIRFSEECNQCGVCAEHCFYDALQISRVGT